jgi:hypothetical protein
MEGKKLYFFFKRNDRYDITLKNSLKRTNVIWMCVQIIVNVIINNCETIEAHNRATLVKTLTGSYSRIFKSKLNL